MARKVMEGEGILAEKNKSFNYYLEKLINVFEIVDKGIGRCF
jgi:hypothetical protein